MSDPTAPDLAQIQRGSVALTTAVRISTLLPGEQEAISSILRSLNTADELLPAGLALARPSRPELIGVDAEVDDANSIGSHPDAFD